MAKYKNAYFIWLS